jgi:predicted DsbA family dithiol-disulfide isomerase
MDLSAFFKRFLSKRVVIYADFIDPFCYIGYHNLRLAAEPRDIQLEWRGFELNPLTPPEGFDLTAAPNSDFHAGMWASVEAFARASGLTIAPPPHVSNTHLVLTFLSALPSSLQKNLLIRELYGAYFNGNLDMNQPDQLRALARQAGMADGAIEAAFNRGKTAERALMEHKQQALSHAFAGMPGFVYRGKSYFGAMSRAAWETIFDHVQKPKESHACSTK